MDENEAIVLGALALGFVEKGDGKYECTREQIIMLCAIVANEAIKQVLGEDR